MRATGIFGGLAAAGVWLRRQGIEPEPISCEPARGSDRRVLNCNDYLYFGNEFMAEYYDMQEVAGKLRKTEEQVQKLVKQGRLRQYMDSGKAVFEVQEVDALVEEIVGLDVSSVGLSPDGSEMEIQLDETAEIQLEPDEETEEGSSPAGPDDMELDIEPDMPGQKESEGGFGLSQMGDLTMADTNVGTVGINILSGTGDAYQLSEDTKAETSIEDIDDLDSLDGLDGDSNMESFGSGSGLLDLSLQADDTSLGAVLDDILPAGAEEGGADFPVDEMGLVDETDDLLGGGDAGEGSPAEITAPMGAAPAVMPTIVPIATVVDPGTNFFGVMMFLPLLGLILAAVVLTAAIQNVVPALMQPLVTTEVAGVSLIWVVVGGLTALMLLILAFSAVAGGGGGTKTKTTKKVKKEKKAKKEKKPKKVKPAKKKRK
jgi:hypothetical protein